MSDLLVFHLGGQRIGVSSAFVREVVRAVTIVPVPKAPPIVEGVIDYRGAIAAVLDLRARFGLDPAPLDIHQHFIVAEARRLVALRVDRADDVVSLAPGVTEEIDSGAPYVTGVVKLADGLVLIHDLATFLSIDEELALETALQDAESEARV